MSRINLLIGVFLLLCSCSSTLSSAKRTEQPLPKSLVGIATKDMAFSNKSSGAVAAEIETLFTDQDIRWVCYEQEKNVEVAFSLKPFAYQRLKSVLPTIRMNSFVIQLDETPIYSGIIATDSYSAKHISARNYEGLVMFLPDENFMSFGSDVFFVEYFAQDGMYFREDDPHGDYDMKRYLIAKNFYKSCP